jgi:hypothetical protein
MATATLTKSDKATQPQAVTAEATNRPAALSIAGLQREQLTTYAGVTPLARIVDESVRPGGALEAMLCDQLTAAHNAGMRLRARASVVDGVEPTVKLTLAAARMMTTFQEGLLALNRMRHAEPATVVQQVSVTDGGQAIVAGVLKAEPNGPTK